MCRYIGNRAGEGVLRRYTVNLVDWLSYLSALGRVQGIFAFRNETRKAK